MQVPTGIGIPTLCVCRFLSLGLIMKPKGRGQQKSNLKPSPHTYLGYNNVQFNKANKLRYLHRNVLTNHIHSLPTRIDILTGRDSRGGHIAGCVGPIPNSSVRDMKCTTMLLESKRRSALMQGGGRGLAYSHSLKLNQAG